jgi:hypothetical protein
MSSTAQNLSSAAASSERQSWFNYRTIWRWHFYAGLFCIPFVIWLSITGSIYVFKPQIERFLDRPYDSLNVTGKRATADAQVKAALAAVPGSSLHYYELPRTPESASRRDGRNHLIERSVRVWDWSQVHHVAHVVGVLHRHTFHPRHIVVSFCSPWMECNTTGSGVMVESSKARMWAAAETLQSSFNSYVVLRFMLCWISRRLSWWVLMCFGAT